jgi:outer membrane protein
MRKMLIAALLVLVAGLAVPGSGVAQDQSGPPTPSIAIVDVEAIMRQSLAVQSARTQIDEIAGNLQQSIAEEEEKLRAEEQALQQQRSLLAPDAYAERNRSLQERAAGLQQRARSLRTALDRGMAQTMQRIQRVAFEEIGKLAEEKGINLVLPRSQIVVAVDSFNITDEALERLNERLSEVEMSLEREPSAGQGGN